MQWFFLSIWDKQILHGYTSIIYVIMYGAKSFIENKAHLSINSILRYNLISNSTPKLIGTSLYVLKRVYNFPVNASGWVPFFARAFWKLATRNLNFNIYNPFFSLLHVCPLIYFGYSGNFEFFSAQSTLNFVTQIFSNERDYATRWSTRIIKIIENF